MADYRLRAELRLLRNQVLAFAGHKPGRADEPPFAEQYPLLAESMGLRSDPETSAERMVEGLQRLALSTRVDAA